MQHSAGQRPLVSRSRPQYAGVVLSEKYNLAYIYPITSIMYAATLQPRRRPNVSDLTTSMFSIVRNNEGTSK